MASNFTSVDRTSDLQGVVAGASRAYHISIGVALFLIVGAGALALARHQFGVDKISNFYIIPGAAGLLTGFFAGKKYNEMNEAAAEFQNRIHDVEISEIPQRAEQKAEWKQEGFRLGFDPQKEHFRKPTPEDEQEARLLEGTTNLEDAVCEYDEIPEANNTQVKKWIQQNSDKAHPTLPDEQEAQLSYGIVNLDNVQRSESDFQTPSTEESPFANLGGVDMTDGSFSESFVVCDPKEDYLEWL